MPVTAADIRREHNDAILSMTDRQRRVLARIMEAKQMGAIGPLSGRTMDERLTAVCEREASRLAPNGKANPLDALFAPSAAA